MATHGSAGLSGKRRRFVDEYLLDCNATQAAIRAGYSERAARVTGARLLANAAVREAIAAAQAERSERVRLDADWVLQELQNNHQAAHAMKRKDLLSSNKALELIGKHLGMFTEKHELNVKMSYAQLVAQAAGGEPGGDQGAGE